MDTFVRVEAPIMGIIPASKTQQCYECQGWGPIDAIIPFVVAAQKYSEAAKEAGMVEKANESLDRLSSAYPSGGAA